MRGANRNRRKYSRSALKQKMAGPLASSQKRPNPGDKTVIDPFRAQGGKKDVGINIVKAIFNILEQQRNFEGQVL